MKKTYHARINQKKERAISISDKVDFRAKKKVMNNNKAIDPSRNYSNSKCVHAKKLTNLQL